MLGEGMDKKSRQDKLDKIFSVLLPFIFDYDIKYNDYLILSYEKLKRILMRISIYYIYRYI